MERSIHNETDMVKADKELESGVPTEEEARDHGVTGRLRITGSQSTTT